MLLHYCSILKSAVDILIVTGQRTGEGLLLLPHASIGQNKDRPVTSTPATKLGEKQRELSTYERLKQSMSVLDGPDDEDEFENLSMFHQDIWQQRLRLNGGAEKSRDLNILAYTKWLLKYWACRRCQVTRNGYALAQDVRSLGTEHVSWQTIEKLKRLGNWVRNDLIRKPYVAVDDEIMDISGSGGEVFVP